MIRVYIWPDDTWIYADEYCAIEHSSKGDDFFTKEFPDDFPEEAIDEIITSGGYTD